MSKVAFVFPGQGSQSVGMGKDLYEHFPEARAVFDGADDALGEKLSRLCFEGPEDVLKLTANTQPAILTTSLAAHAVVSKRLSSAVAFLAGHSLGEYSALVASGTLSLSDAVRSVRARGRLMQDAVPEGVGAMAAVLGLAPEKVAQICEKVAQGEILSPANYNSPEQTVIAGHARAVERATVPLKEAGAKRIVPLPVSAPFHCALMEPVKDPLAKVLAEVSFHPMLIPVFSNVEAKPNQRSESVARLLLEQVTAPVRWVETVEELERQGITDVVEVGPGKVLSGLVKRTGKSMRVFSVENSDSLNKALAGLGIS